MGLSGAKGEFHFWSKAKNRKLFGGSTHALVEFVPGGFDCTIFPSGGGSSSWFPRESNHGHL